MDPMTEGTRIHVKRDGTFDAEVVMNSQVVWRQAGYRVKEVAQAEANRQLAHLKLQR